jgi:hypothetical protein
MVSVLPSSAVDRGFEPRSGQTKDYKIDICCFSAKRAALRSKSKDWLSRNQNNVSEWSDMFTHRLLFQWASTIQIQLSVLVYNKADLIIISYITSLFFLYQILTDITIFSAELSTQKYITSPFSCIRFWLILPFSMQNFLHKSILPPLLSVLYYAVIFWLRFWGRPQSQCEKGSFSPIIWGKIPNSVVIKLFVKIGNKIFFKWN